MNALRIAIAILVLSGPSSVRALALDGLINGQLRFACTNGQASVGTASAGTPFTLTVWCPGLGEYAGCVQTQPTVLRHSDTTLVFQCGVSGPLDRIFVDSFDR
jgi:hypothetical protein